jgi:hypothetical protein
VTCWRLALAPIRQLSALLLVAKKHPMLNTCIANTDRLAPGGNHRWLLLGDAVGDDRRDGDVAVFCHLLKPT